MPLWPSHFIVWWVSEGSMPFLPAVLCPVIKSSLAHFKQSAQLYFSWKVTLLFFFFFFESSTSMGKSGHDARHALSMVIENNRSFGGPVADREGSEDFPGRLHAADLTAGAVLTTSHLVSSYGLPYCTMAYPTAPWLTLLQAVRPTSCLVCGHCLTMWKTALVFVSFTVFRYIACSHRLNLLRILTAGLPAQWQPAYQHSDSWPAQWQPADQHSDSQLTSTVTASLPAQWQPADQHSDSQLTSTVTASWPAQWQPAYQHSDSQLTTVLPHFDSQWQPAYQHSDSQLTSTVTLTDRAVCFACCVCPREKRKGEPCVNYAVPMIFHFLNFAQSSELFVLAFFFHQHFVIDVFELIDVLPDLYAHGKIIMLPVNVSFVCVCVCVYMSRCVYACVCVWM